MVKLYILFTRGGGTQSNPYLISSAVDLAKMASMINSSTSYRSSYFKLTADIDLKDHYWVPIGNSSSRYFMGTFDGDGHIISNIIIDPGQYACEAMGLFGRTGKASSSSTSVTIKNLQIDAANITGSASAGVRYLGVLVGYSGGNKGDIIQNINIGKNSGVMNSLLTPTNLKSGTIDTGLVCGYAIDAHISDILIDGANVASQNMENNKCTSISYFGGVVGRYIVTSTYSSSTTVTSFKDIDIIDLRIGTFQSNVRMGGLCGAYEVQNGSYSYHQLIENIYISDGYNRIFGSVSQSETTGTTSGGLFGTLSCASEVRVPYIRCIFINQIIATKDDTLPVKAFVGEMNSSFPAKTDYLSNIHANNKNNATDMDSGIIGNDGQVFWYQNWDRLPSYYWWKDMNTKARLYQALAVNEYNNDGPGVGLLDGTKPMCLNKPFMKKYPSVKPLKEVLYVCFESVFEDGFSLPMVITDDDYIISPILDDFYSYDGDVIKGDTIYWKPNVNGTPEVYATIKPGEKLTVTRNLAVNISRSHVYKNHNVDFKDDNSVIRKTKSAYYKSDSSTIKQVANYNYKNSDGVLI